MKQSELDKIVNLNLKNFGKQFLWKYRSGFLFIKKNDLFFYLIILPVKNAKHLSISLHYKWFDFDNIFWNIVNLPDNKKQPLSFHATGAWTMPAMNIFDQNIHSDDWENFDFTLHISNAIKTANDISNNLISRIKTIDDNIIYIRKLYNQLLLKYPDALTKIFKEELITMILNKKFKEARMLASERLQKNDTGGFCSGSKSFYQMAIEFLNDKC